MRDSWSRPSSSVPNQCDQDGPTVPRVRFWWSREYGAKIVAPKQTTQRTTSTPIEASATLWRVKRRQNSCPGERCSGAPPVVGAVAGGSSSDGPTGPGSGTTGPVRVGVSRDPDPGGRATRRRGQRQG